LRRLFRDRQLVIKNLVELNSNLRKIPAVIAQFIVVLVCESAVPEFFNYPYFHYPVSNMYQRSFLKLSMTAGFLLGMLPSVISLAMYPSNYVSQSRDVLRWVLVDELTRRFIKELCFRWVGLCTIMLAVMCTDFTFAYAHPILMGVYILWDVYSSFKRSGLDTALLIRIMANLVLVGMVWNVHWVFEFCSALGASFHSVTFNMNNNVLYGPEWSQSLFSFALLATFLLPDSYYTRKLSPPEDIETNTIQRNVLILLGWLFSFIDSQLMIYTTLHYGLFPALVLCMGISLIAVFSQGAVRNFAQTFGIKHEFLRVEKEYSNDDEGGDT
jgi:hypothetical protein